MKRAIIVGSGIFLLVLGILIGIGFSSQKASLPKSDSGPSDKEYSEAPLDKDNLQPNEERSNLVLVTRVIDGDTIEIEGGRRVRYIGIDTPEPSQCFGPESTQKNRELVEAKLVLLKKDVSETDRYGRLLVYVWVGDTFVNEALVREGYANVSTYPPDVSYQDVFLAAQQKARAEGKGLWGNALKVQVKSRKVQVPRRSKAQRRPLGVTLVTAASLVRKLRLATRPTIN